MALSKYLLNKFQYIFLFTLVSCTVHTGGAQKIIIDEKIDQVRKVPEMLRIPLYIKRNMRKKRGEEEKRE